MQRSLCYGPRMLSDDILSLWVHRVQGLVYTFQKDLPNSHKGLRSHTEVGKKWLFRGPIIAGLGSQPGTCLPSSQPALCSVYFSPSLQELQFTVSILFRLSRGSYRHKAKNHHRGNTGGFFASLTLMLILSLTV